jgi:hypothetical protein
MPAAAAAGGASIPGALRGSVSAGSRLGLDVRAASAPGPPASGATGLRPPDCLKGGEPASGTCRSSSADPLQNTAWAAAGGGSGRPDPRSALPGRMAAAAAAGGTSIPGALRGSASAASRVDLDAEAASAPGAPVSRCTVSHSPASLEAGEPASAVSGTRPGTGAGIASASRPFPSPSGLLSPAAGVEGREGWTAAPAVATGRLTAATSPSRGALSSVSPEGVAAAAAGSKRDGNRGRNGRGTRPRARAASRPRKSLTPRPPSPGRAGGGAG